MLQPKRRVAHQKLTAAKNEVVTAEFAVPDAKNAAD